VPDWQTLPPWNTASGEQLDAQQDQEDLLAASRPREQIQRDYAAYCASDAWRSKEQKVLQRDRNCRACDGGPAVTVHHLTYQRLFREPLFDLIGVCRGCYLLHYRESELNEAIGSLARATEPFVFRW
jgi:hypothetical protein